MFKQRALINLAIIYVLIFLHNRLVANPEDAGFNYDESYATYNYSNNVTDGCDLPDSGTTGYLHLTSDGSVLYNSNEAIGGFQFDVVGATVSSGSGGDAAAAGLLVQSMGSTVLAFSMTGGSIPAGCGTLVNLNLNGEASGLTDIVVSDAVGSQINFEFYDRD